MRFEDRNCWINLEMEINIDGRTHFTNEDFFDALCTVDTKCMLLNCAGQRHFRHGIHQLFDRKPSEAEPVDKDDRVPRERRPVVSRFVPLAAVQSDRDSHPRGE